MLLLSKKQNEKLIILLVDFRHISVSYNPTSALKIIHKSHRKNKIRQNNLTGSLSVNTTMWGRLTDLNRQSCNCRLANQILTNNAKLKYKQKGINRKPYRFVMKKLQLQLKKVLMVLKLNFLIKITTLYLIKKKQKRKQKIKIQEQIQQLIFWREK